MGSSDFQLPVWRVKQLLRHEAESSRPVSPACMDCCMHVMRARTRLALPSKLPSRVAVTCWLFDAVVIRFAMDHGLCPMVCVSVCLSVETTETRKDGVVAVRSRARLMPVFFSTRISLLENRCMGRFLASLDQDVKGRKAILT